MLDPKTIKFKNLTGKDPVERMWNKEKLITEGSLMVWWIPQVPMNGFLFPVENLREAKHIILCLGKYDLFQYENRIKGDYSNVGGLLVFEDDEWVEWADIISGNGIDDIIIKNDIFK